jgi:diguanylate cyclase (GGDEF)-like protein
MNESATRVLLVDDDPAMLRLLATWLEAAGYTVVKASDGNQALAAVEADCPDFIITDWEMPHVNGLELCRRVREMSLPHYVHVLFVTVRSGREEMIEGLNVGADDFLCKPVLQSELLARLRCGARVLARERRLSQMASTDSLTSLMTQRAFYETLNKEWHRSGRSGAPMSCVMLDLDFFKRVNDVRGHLAGDAVLRATAELLLTNCRRSDSLCRYGGEEFCALLPDTTDLDAAAWADRARRRLAEMAISVAGKKICITGSFGTAQRHDDTSSPEQLVDMADQALLCAKQSGRDCVVRFESLTDSREFEVTHPRSPQALCRGITAGQVMTPLIIFLRENDSVNQAADLFLHCRMNSTPVLDADGQLAGMLSEKDLLAAMASLDCWQHPIREIMKPNVICYEEDTPINTVYEFLCRVSIRRVVITRNGQPTGTISRSTLIRWFRNLVASRDVARSLDAMKFADNIPGFDCRICKAE